MNKWFGTNQLTIRPHNQISMTQTHTRVTFDKNVAKDETFDKILTSNSFFFSLNQIVSWSQRHPTTSNQRIQFS